MVKVLALQKKEALAGAAGKLSSLLSVVCACTE